MERRGTAGGGLGECHYMRRRAPTILGRVNTFSCAATIPDRVRTCGRADQTPTCARRSGRGGELPETGVKTHPAVPFHAPEIDIVERRGTAGDGLGECHFMHRRAPNTSGWANTIPCAAVPRRFRCGRMSFYAPPCPRRFRCGREPFPAPPPLKPSLSRARKEPGRVFFPQKRRLGRCFCQAAARACCTTALNAPGSRTARSARTLRFRAMPVTFIPCIRRL